MHCLSAESDYFHSDQLCQSLFREYINMTLTRQHDWELLDSASTQLSYKMEGQGHFLPTVTVHLSGLASRHHETQASHMDEYINSSITYYQQFNYILCPLRKKYYITLFFQALDSIECASIFFCVMVVRFQESHTD